jgi:hypothetical protein
MFAPSAAPPAASAERAVPRHQTLADLRSVAVLDVLADLRSVLDVLADPGRSVARLPIGDQMRSPIGQRATSGTHGPTPSEGYVHLR